MRCWADIILSGKFKHATSHCSTNQHDHGCHEDHGDRRRGGAVVAREPHLPRRCRDVGIGRRHRWRLFRTDELSRLYFCSSWGGHGWANTSFIGWTTGNSGAGVPHQKMASLVEAIYFKLSGMMSTRLRENIKCNFFHEPCNFAKIVRIMPQVRWQQCCHIIVN